MKNQIGSILTILFLSLSSANLAEASTDKKLSQNDVVASADKNYPKILSYYEKVSAAEGTALGSLGFFDIRLKQNYADKSRGFFDGKTTDTLLEK